MTTLEQLADHARQRTEQAKRVLPRKKSGIRLYPFQKGIFLFNKH